MSSSDAVYEVEKILDFRLIKNRKQYLIRWKGYDSSNDTWEPHENLSECHEALDEFWTSREEDPLLSRKNVTNKPFIGIRSETMKRASAALAAREMSDVESGELTDSDDEARKRKKKKHRHDKEYWTAKKQRKKERKEKEQRKKGRRERRSEDGGSNCSEHATNFPAGREAAPPKKTMEVAGPSTVQRRVSGDGQGAKRTWEEAVQAKCVRTGSKEGSSTGVLPSEVPSGGGKISKLPRVPRLPPCASVAPRGAKGTQPKEQKGADPQAKSSTAPAAEAMAERAAASATHRTEAVDTQQQAVVNQPQFPDDLSDDEMGEADLCIVEETGECFGDNQEMLMVVDEFVQDAEEGNAKPANGSANMKAGSENEQENRDENHKEEENKLMKDKEEQQRKPTSKDPPSEENVNENGTTSKAPLIIRPANNSVPASTNEKTAAESLPPPIQKKRRSCDPMWDELDGFTVVHSLKDLEQAHKDDMKRSALKKTMDEIVGLVQNGNIWLIKFALEHEACPRLDTAEEPLIFYAAQRGYDDILELLLSRKADVNKPSGTNTPLMAAAEAGYLTTTSLLLTCGAYMNTVNSKGETAMIRAVKRGSLKTVRCLLDHGANFNAMVSESRHARAWASKMKLTEIDQLLSSYEDYIGKQVEEKAKQSMEGFGQILERILPVHVLSFWEAEEFQIWFNAKVYPVKPGEGNLFFLANAVFQDGEMRCQLRGDCFVEKVVLNDVEQCSVTKTGQFILSFSPLHDGNNKCTIFTKIVPYPSLRFVVAAYRIRLKNR